ncbi:MAG: GntR family transcriptional regulator [Spirochaetota bacterium]
MYKALETKESENSPLYKLVYHKLREAILNGQLAPGTKLVEQAISTQMAISKTPVREAIRELAQEGLILFKARRGISVIDFTEKDINELVTLRANLEMLGVRLALGKLTKEDFSALDSILDRIIAKEKSRGYAELSDLDIEFHQFIIQKSDNKRLEKAWKDIASQMHVLFRMIRYYEFSDTYMSMMHKDLILALSSKDLAVCEKVFHSHILLNEENILAVFRGRNQKDIKKKAGERRKAAE